MAIFHSGSAANKWALDQGAKAMHMIRYSETLNDEYHEQTEYWVKDKRQDPDGFNNELAEYIARYVRFDTLIQYQIIKFD